MPDVPRRLPRTQGQRVKNVAITHASLSGGGSTAAARPVDRHLPDPKIYEPPTTTDSNVVTGDSSGESAVSITSTTTGDGTSAATASGAVAVGQYAEAEGFESVAIGLAHTESTASGGIAIGWNALATGAGSIAIGSGLSGSAWASGDHSVAVGAGALAGDFEIVLGDGRYVVVAVGGLVLRDSSGGLHKLVVSTGGALSTVTYP